MCIGSMVPYNRELLMLCTRDSCKFGEKIFMCIGSMVPYNRELLMLCAPAAIMSTILS